MKNEFKVSIITPVYNASRFLSETSKSVIKQTYENWEWVLVDDCSTDNSWEMLQELSNSDVRIKIYRNEINSGSGVSRNFAIEKAKGDIIAFIDSDDIWHPDKLRLQLEFMDSNSFDFTHTSFGYIDENGQKIKSTFHVSKKAVSYYDLLKRTEIGCLTAMYNSKNLGKFYMSEHRRKQDYALWLSILKAGSYSNGLDIELAYYRIRKGSATSNKFKLIKLHYYFLKETQKMSSIKSIYYTLYWLINGFIRYYIK